VGEEVWWEGRWVKVAVEGVFGFEDVIEECGEFLEWACE
jgi:hypothetical protein